MANHLHLVFRDIKEKKPELLLTYFKKVTNGSSNVKHCHTIQSRGSRGNSHINFLKST